MKKKKWKGGEREGVHKIQVKDQGHNNEWVSEKSLSHVWLFVTPWTVAHQAPLSMEFSRQEYWSGLPFPSPGESSWHRDWTRVSHIAGRRFTVWATTESQGHDNLDVTWILVG